MNICQSWAQISEPFLPFRERERTHFSTLSEGFTSHMTQNNLRRSGEVTASPPVPLLEQITDNDLWHPLCMRIDISSPWLSLWQPQGRCKMPSFRIKIWILFCNFYKPIQRWGWGIEGGGGMGGGVEEKEGGDGGGRQWAHLHLLREKSTIHDSFHVSCWASDMATILATGS